MTSSESALTPGNFTTLFEDTDFPPSSLNLVPVAITTVTCIAVIMLIVVVLKICALLRRRRILNFVGRVFTPSSESQQKLPVKNKKHSKEFLSCSHKRKVATDSSEWEDDVAESCEQAIEHTDEISKCIELKGEAWTIEEPDCNLHVQDEVECPEKFAVINPDLYEKEFEVEVEVHPSIYQEYHKTKSLLSKIARGSSSQDSEEEDLCANPIYPSTAIP